MDFPAPFIQATAQRLARAPILSGVLMHRDMALVAFRWLVVGCQGATLLITWPLWQVHTYPPVLPLLPLPQFDMGPLLLVSLALILVLPVKGVILHTALIGYAVLIDQIRLQPEIISLLLVLWGTLPNPNARALGRAHLIALWTWAGFNKLLSPAFLSGTGPGLFGTFLPSALVWLRPYGGYIIALTELTTGLLAMFPRTRKLSGAMAFGLHIGIFLTLSPLGRDWNESVWPWNIALAAAGLALIFPWKEPLLRSMGSCRPLVRLLVVLILVAPAGFYVGLTDAYLAHNLYSSNVPRASSRVYSSGSTWSAFNVPLPPEPRLYEQWFRLMCKPGDELTIRDTRWWFRVQGLDQRHLTCPPS